MLSQSKRAYSYSLCDCRTQVELYAAPCTFCVYNVYSIISKFVTIVWRMFEIVLFEPEIPPNTGNIIRLCANTGCQLHLIEPLGFSINEKAMRRAGLDYHDATQIEVHPSLEQCLCSSSNKDQRVFAFSTKGQTLYSDVAYKKGDVLLFGPETRGLPESVRTYEKVTDVLTLPMRANNRSLNLSNTVAIATYEAWRQCGFGQ